MQVRPHPEGWAVTRAQSRREPAIYWSRRYAIDAGREVAERDLADLQVYNEDGQVDFHVSYSKKATGRRWNSRRRAASASSESDVERAATPVANLLELVLPYDPWCLRTARRESARVLAGTCPPEALDELLLVITELVMYSTVESRSECTLSMQRMDDDDILVVVRDLHPSPNTSQRNIEPLGTGMGAMHSMTTEYGVERAVGRRCVWARFNLLGGPSNPD